MKTDLICYGSVYKYADRDYVVISVMGDEVTLQSVNPDSHPYPQEVIMSREDLTHKHYVS